jgi:hypothetical protein
MHDHLDALMFGSIFGFIIAIFGFTIALIATICLSQ